MKKIKFRGYNKALNAVVYGDLTAENFFFISDIGDTNNYIELIKE